jgi:predicted alpha/beta hydrolase
VAAVEKRDLELAADDGYRLQATLFEPAEQTTRPLVIMASATGVPQGYYARFASFLAEHGRPVLTFDPRGIGRSAPASLKGFDCRFRDWGIKDFPGVIDWAQTTYPGRPLHWVGHSYGGFGLGLARNNGAIEKLLGVSTMTADARLVDNKLGALQIGVMLFGVGPLVARTLGYVPGRLFGGSGLPRGVVLEWAEWCRTPGFLFGVDDLPERRHFATLTADVRLTLVTDDGWLGKRGVEHLLGQFPAARSRDLWTITPHDGAGHAIGHLGFFRSQFRDTLWPKALAWLDA